MSSPTIFSRLSSPTTLFFFSSSPPSSPIEQPSVSPPLSTTSPANGRVPSPPLPTPVSASVTNTPFRPPTPDRAATPKASALAERRGRSRGMSESVLKKRKVSPMGERMLKGHFDGFGL